MKRSLRQYILVLFLLLPHPSLLLAQTPVTSVIAPRPQAVSLEGTWSGTMEVGSTTLHFVLHIAKERDGSLKATLDSVDQGVYAIEATSVVQKEFVFSFGVVSVGATYAGRISTNNQSIEGNWSQSGATLPLVFHRQAGGSATKKPSDAVSDLEGLWQGLVESNGLHLRLQLHISHDDKKRIRASLDSIDQAITGIPAANVSLTGSKLHFEIPSISTIYDGDASAAKNVITGTWTQAETSQKLDFKRSNEVLQLRRPQNPAKPYPYREEEVNFPNAKAQIALSGTLSLPSSPGPFPVAILIGDSGPRDRDASIAGHRPFLVLADYLTRRGFAVLRYDKRGIGKSTGDFVNAVTEDFAADAESALAYLHSRKEINPAKIGLIGHGEGAIIASMMASRSTDLPWVVLLAASGLSGEQNLLLQSEQIARASGMSEEAIEKSLDFDKKAYALGKEEKDRAALESKLVDLVIASGMADSASPNEIESQIHAMSSAWFRGLLANDPIPVLQKIKCPALVLTGEKDLQVPANQNLSAIRKAFQDGGNKDFQAIELPSLNHLFQHAQTGTPREYGAIEETFSPEAMKIISDWIQKHSNP